MRRFLNLFLFLSFQICYLEWPPHNSMFVFQVQFDIFSKTDHLLTNLVHPIILLGLVAQLLLLFGFFIANFKKKLNAIGILLLGLLVVLFLLISVLSKNITMFLATLPYLILSVYYFLNNKKLA